MDVSNFYGAFLIGENDDSVIKLKEACRNTGIDPNPGKSGGSDIFLTSMESGL